MSLWDLTALLSRNNVPVIDVDANEPVAEFEAVDELVEQMEGESGA